MPGKTKVFLFIVEPKIVKKTKEIKKIVLNIDLIREVYFIFFAFNVIFFYLHRPLNL